MYYHGKGVSQDLGKAVRFYKLAADQGFQPAQDALLKLKEEQASSILYSFSSSQKRSFEEALSEERRESNQNARSAKYARR